MFNFVPEYKIYLSVLGSGRNIRLVEHFSPVPCRVQINFIFRDNVHIFCIQCHTSLYCQINMKKKSTIQKMTFNNLKHNFNDALFVLCVKQVSYSDFRST